jgi:DNA/RNA endonuclease G (NUC1)
LTSCKHVCAHAKQQRIIQDHRNTAEKIAQETRFLNNYKRFSSAGPSAKRQNGIGEDVQDQLSYLDLGVSYFLKRKLATASKPSLETNTLRNEDALRRW